MWSKFGNKQANSSSFYLLLVSSFKIDSHVLWFRHKKKQTHLPKCSYHDIKAEVKSRGGQTRLGVSLRSASALASSFEEEKYGCNLNQNYATFNREAIKSETEEPNQWFK